MDTSQSTTIPSLPHPNPNPNPKPKLYILIYNIQSRHNILTLIHSAISFGCRDVLVLGKDKKVMSKYLDKEKPLIKSYINYIYFETIPELTAYIKEKHIYVCGVEIGETSVPIQNMVFKGDTLFILGNEGAGMNNKQKELCDDFVYIQQYTRKTGSLNVAIAASIIFHHFSIWAGY